MWRNGKVIASKVKKDTYKPYSYSSTTKPYALWDTEQSEYELGYEEVPTAPIDTSKIVDVDPDTGEITGGAQDDVEASFFAQEG